MNELLSQDSDDCVFSHQNIASKWMLIHSFRAAIHHPDKVATTADSESYFLHLRKAQETLIDPNKRFAYERFGPAVLEWQHCSSIQDYLAMGLQQVLPYYAAGGFFLIFLGVMGYLETGRYVSSISFRVSSPSNPCKWRFVSSAILLIFELYTVTRPYFSPLSTKIINPVLARVADHPPLLPFQQIILARKLILTLFLAISQLGPILERPDQKLQANSVEAQNQQLDRLEHLSKAVDVEATRLLGFDMAPFAVNEKSAQDVKKKLQEWLVQHAVRATPEVRNAVGKVMTRRRPDAPAGAQGTK